MYRFLNYKYSQFSNLIWNIRRCLFCLTFPPYSMGHKKGLFRLDIHFFTYLGKTCTDNLSRKKKNLTDRVEIVNSISSQKFWYGEEWRHKCWWCFCDSSNTKCHNNNKISNKCVAANFNCLTRLEWKYH